MAPYRITLLNTDGDVQDEHLIDLVHDDAAIDRADAFAHPHAIEVWQGERHVVTFPPLPGSKPRSA